ncbi:hypothetical protein C8Q72DRAFT_814187 [Fomitopsis betulina]|nr:hypothetical protein C8Q72DRAFT_814187 [Fomitopsis betulina]
MSPDPAPSSCHRHVQGLGLPAGHPPAHREFSSDEKVCSWLAGVEDSLHGVPLTFSEGSVIHRTQYFAQSGAVAPSEIGTSVCSSTSQSPPKQTTTSESGSVSIRLDARCCAQAQTCLPDYPNTKSAPLTMELASLPSAPEAPPSYSPAGSRKSDTFSEGHKYNEQASTKSASSAGSGPTRVTHSRVSTSSGSSVSRHLDFNVPPIDLQLLPVTRSARATTASRSSVKLADSSASLGVEPASSTSVPSAGTASQSTVSLIFDRSRVVFKRPTYPDATALNLQGGGPFKLKTDMTLFDDIATLLGPAPSFHAPALGYYHLARDTSRKPLVLVGDEHPPRDASGQGDVRNEMLLIPSRRS